MHRTSVDAECVSAVPERTFAETLQRFVSICQVLSADAAAHDRPLREIAQCLSAALPHPNCSADFLLLRSIIAEFATRAMDARGCAASGAVLPLVRLTPGDQPLGPVLVRCLSQAGADETTVRPSPQARRARQAVVVINARCGEVDLDATAVASELKISERALCRVLHEHTGGGFRTILRQARIAAAQALLDDSVCSIKEIAAQVGYSWTSQFDRDFHRECGITPGEYRTAPTRS